VIRLSRVRERKGRNRWLKRLGLVYCCALGIYLGSFYYFVDVFSSPVRTSNHWVGPGVRGDTSVVDTGKVWHPDTPDSLYNRYRPLCVEKTI